MFNLSNLGNLSYISNFNLHQYFYNQNPNLVGNSATSSSAKTGWLNNVFGCLVPIGQIWNTIGKGKAKQNSWEIPFDSIRNLEWIR